MQVALTKIKKYKKLTELWVRLNVKREIGKRLPRSSFSWCSIISYEKYLKRNLIGFTFIICLGIVSVIKSECALIDFSEQCKQLTFGGELNVASEQLTANILDNQFHQNY